MKQLGLFVLVIILATFLGFLGTKVIMSISELYKLTFIASLGFAKVWALGVIIRLFIFENKSKKEEKSFEEVVKDTFLSVFVVAIAYLSVWGLAFIMHNFLV